jgi:hypothetical protein
MQSLKPKEQRAALLVDEKRFKRAEFIEEIHRALTLYLSTKDGRWLNIVQEAINDLRKLDENPEIHTPRCIIY